MIFDMKKNEEKERLVNLKKRAEGLLSEGSSQVSGLSSEAIQKIIHDLRTFQIELMLQNEELQEHQLQLDESRALYQDLYDHAPVGYFTFDGRGRIVAVNRTGSRLLGLEKDLLLQKPFTFFMREDDSDLFYLHLKKVFAAGSKQTCALMLFKEESHSIYAQLDSVPSFPVTGTKRLCQTTITDISERKALEEALTISEIRYRRFFEASTEGILLIDAETGHIFNGNPFLMEMLGYSLEELLGKKLWEIGCFKDIEANKEAFGELQRKEYVHYEDLPLETKNGRILAVELVSTLYTVHDRKVIQCSLRDITGRKLRGEPQEVRKQLEPKIQEHRQLEESFLNALAENKMLKDRLVAENIYFQQKNNKKHQVSHIIGQSDGIKDVLYRVEQVAPTDTTVLILGETGTGKELIATAIHHLSSRKNKSLIMVNCAALPANLLESELFGREKGAFTGAETRQIGRFELADGSTLCLDEIGELPVEMQAKLLRVIQHGEFERLGSSKTIKVNVRIVAITNRCLEQMTLAGEFRSDLFYRLNVFPITVPPLRQRQEDIPLMVEKFVARYAEKMGKKITSIPKATMMKLQEYHWPGNVRELESIIERAMILCAGPGFQLADTLNIASPQVSFMAGTLKDLERNQIIKVLIETGGRIEGRNGAAKILGLHPSTLRARMQKFGIVRSEMK